MFRAILLLTFAFIFTGCSTMMDSRDFVKPKALQPGDTIAMVAPARALGEEQIAIATAALEERGYHVVHQPNISAKYRGYLNAPDEEKARLLMEAFEDPEIDGIFPVTGGFSTTRMIRFLDYDVIRQNPKVVIGYSDITGLHCAIEAQAGLISFHAPYPTYMYYQNPEREYQDKSFAIHHFWEAIEAPMYEKRDGDLVFPQMEATTPTVTLSNPKNPKAVGRLTGGNLSLVHALYGTPYLSDPEGKILFLEDIGEDPYRIDRMLSQLENGGYLAKLNGVILGKFRNCETDNPERSLTLIQVFEDYFAHRDYPVFYHFPVGHVPENVPMPNGALVEMDAETKTIRFLEDPVAWE